MLLKISKVFHVFLQIWQELWCSNLENMENTLKINVFRKSILFCKFLHNGSLDLYEILYCGQLLSCELISVTKARFFMKFYTVVNHYLVSLCFNFHEDLCINAHAWVINVRTRDETCAHAFMTYTFLMWYDINTDFLLVVGHDMLTLLYGVYGLHAIHQLLSSSRSCLIWVLKNEKCTDYLTNKLTDGHRAR